MSRGGSTVFLRAVLDGSPQKARSTMNDSDAPDLVNPEPEKPGYVWLPTDIQERLGRDQIGMDALWWAYQLYHTASHFKTDGSVPTLGFNRLRKKVRQRLLDRRVVVICGDQARLCRFKPQAWEGGEP